jgi:hypothetical protein
MIVFLRHGSAYSAHHRVLYYTGSIMSRRTAPFRQTDLTRALKAARAGGLDVVKTEIDTATGRIVLFHSTQGPAGLPFDEWKAKRNAS